MLVALCLASLSASRHGVAPPIAATPGAVGVLLVVLARLRPSLVRPLAAGWAVLGHALGRVTTPILLAVVFALVIVPLGLALRLLGKDLLGLRRDPKAASYWIERRRRTFEPGDFERLS
jgi:hypothetical protein